MHPQPLRLRTCGYAIRGVNKSADLACSGPACSVRDSREHVRDVGREVARACVFGRRWPNSAGRAPGEDTGISRPAPPFTPHAGGPAPPTPAVCSLRVNPVGAARVRSGRGHWVRPGAGARPWRSCASGVHSMAQLAVRLLSPEASTAARRRMRVRAIAGLEGERRRALRCACCYVRRPRPARRAGGIPGGFATRVSVNAV